VIFTAYLDEPDTHPTRLLLVGGSADFGRSSDFGGSTDLRNQHHGEHRGHASEMIDDLSMVFSLNVLAQAWSCTNVRIKNVQSNECLIYSIARLVHLLPFDYLNRDIDKRPVEDVS
jgi:hypothetical protein